LQVVDISECVQKAGFSREMVVKSLAFWARSEPLTPLRSVRGSVSLWEILPLTPLRSVRGSPLTAAYAAYA